MKLICLNTWGGRLYEPLMEFLKEQAQDIDVFCLQEVWTTTSGTKEYRDIRANLLQEIGQVCTEHRPYHSVTQEGVAHGGAVDFDIATGNAMLVRKDLTVTEQGEVFLCGEKNSMDVATHARGDYSTNPRLMQWNRIADDAGSTTIFNLHGFHNGKGKLDCSERLVQSARIIETLSRFPGRKILVGDFNLHPDTQSIAMLEEAGLRNLVKEYGITSTRTSHYPRDERFADYVFVSDGIEVKDFRVLPDEVSDHSPLYLEFA